MCAAAPADGAPTASRDATAGKHRAAKPTPGQVAKRRAVKLRTARRSAVRRTARSARSTARRRAARVRARSSRVRVLRESARRHAPMALVEGRIPGRAPLTGSAPATAPAPSPPVSTGGVLTTPADVPAPPPTEGFAALTPAAPTDAPVAAPPAIGALGVRVSETPAYRATLSRGSLAAGTVRLQLQNEGEDDHDLRVVRLEDDSVAAYLERTAPGRARTATVQLRPGTYRLFCTLQAPVVHASAGMSSTLTVTG